MPDANRPTIICEVAFTTANPRTVPLAWTDVSAYLRTDSLSIRRGRSDELQTSQVGTMSCVLRNSDRRFEPLYTSGAYFPNVVPMRRIRISATWNAVTYRLFTGLITAWTPRYDPHTGDEVVDVDAYDYLGFLATVRAPMSPIASGRLAGTVINRVLNDAAWAGVADRDIDTLSDTECAGIAMVTASNSLQVVQLAAQCEWMPVWNASDGRFTFRKRSSRYNPSTPSVIIGGAGNPQATALVLEYGAERYVWNYITVSDTDSPATIVGQFDSASITAYGERARSYTVDLYNPGDVGGLGGHLLSLYKDPRLRIRQITLIGETAPATLWPIILDADINDRIRVNHTPIAGGTAITRDVRIEQIAFTVRGNDWRTEWTLSSAEVADLYAWILQDATYGVLDSTTRLVF